MRQHSGAPKPKWNRQITRRIFPPDSEKSSGNETTYYVYTWKGLRHQVTINSEVITVLLHLCLNMYACMSTTEVFRLLVKKKSAKCRVIYLNYPLM